MSTTEPTTTEPTTTLPAPFLALPAGSLRVQENDANTVTEGGRVILVLTDAAQRELGDGGEFLTGVTVTLVYRKNEPMLSWPLTRIERASQRFTAAFHTGEPPADPAPFFVLPAGSLRVSQNHVHMDMDGGPLVLELTDEARRRLYDEGYITDVRVTLNYRRDEPMEKWPLAPEERLGTLFALAISRETA